jgi:hypothetical protein
MAETYRLLLSDFTETGTFLTDCRKLIKYQFHENPSSVTELFHADGQRYKQKDSNDKANSRYSQFCEGALQTAHILTNPAADSSVSSEEWKRTRHEESIRYKRSYHQQLLLITSMHTDTFENGGRISVTDISHEQLTL